MAKLRFIAAGDANLPSAYCWDNAISVSCMKGGFPFMADRFGYLNQFSPVDAAAISEGLFPSGSSTKTFDDCMMSRAESLAQQASEVVVMWSGGCDSTAVVSAFLDVLSNHKRLTILYTQSSIDENPDFHELLRKTDVKLELVPANELFPIGFHYAQDGKLVITGFPADQLFGSIIGQKFPGDTTKTHWTEYYHSDLVNQQYEAAFSYYGIPIKTVAELLWFNNFALKWDMMAHVMLMMIQRHHDNVVPFYMVYDFEEWSVSNFDILHKYDQKEAVNYKVQMKDFIYQKTKLSSVYNLRKQPSIINAFIRDNQSNFGNYISVAALDDEGVITRVGKKYRDFADDIGVCSATILRKYLKK